MRSIRTERLILRRWLPEDLDPFAAICSDSEVMRYYPSKLSREETCELVERIEKSFSDNGYGLWAVELPGSCRFIGYVGLSFAEFDAPFTPAVEVGWRLAREHWGKGYATEAANASLADGFGRIGLSEIVSFTPAINARSISVMEKAGMERDLEGDFAHPGLDRSHPLSRHVLYRKVQPPLFLGRGK